MYFKDHHGIKKFCMYKKGRNEIETNKYYKEGVVQNSIVLLSGGTGSGKSVCGNVMASEINDVDYTVIYITEKKGEELANAMHIFRPNEDYHHNMLKEQKQEIKTKPARFYHPITLNSSKKKGDGLFEFRKNTVPINFIAFSVKDISRNGFATIIASESEIALDKAVEISRELRDDESFYDLVWRLYEIISSDGLSKDKMFDPNELYIPIESGGDKRTVRNLKDAFKGFRSDFFIHPENSPFIHDYVKMCNDSKHIHHFTTKFIPSKKRKIFAIVEFLSQIDKALSSGLVKKPVVLVFEEMKILMPSTDISPAQRQLLSLLYDMFSRIRTKAFVIATTQSIFDINKEFRGLFDKKFLGKLDHNDLRVLIKDFTLKAIDQEKLRNLTIGQFVLWETDEYSDEQLTEKIAIDVPTFANHEQGEDFFDKFKKTFPDYVKNHLISFHRCRKIREKIEFQRSENLKKWLNQKKLEREAKEMKKEGLVDEAKDKVKELKEEKKEIIMKQVYDMKRLNPKASWRMIARSVEGITNHITAKKYYNEYLENNPDLIEGDE